MRVKAREPLLLIEAPGACSAGSLWPRLTGAGFRRELLRARVPAIAMAELF